MISPTVDLEKLKKWELLVSDSEGDLNIHDLLNEAHDLTTDLYSDSCNPTTLLSREGSALFELHPKSVLFGITLAGYLDHCEFDLEVEESDIDLSDLIQMEKEIKAHAFEQTAMMTTHISTATNNALSQVTVARRKILDEDNDSGGGDSDGSPGSSDEGLREED